MLLRNTRKIHFFKAGLILLLVGCQNLLETEPQPALLNEVNEETRNIFSDSLDRLFFGANVVIDETRFLTESFITLEPPTRYTLEGRVDSGRNLDPPLRLNLVRLKGDCYLVFKDRYELLFNISCVATN